VGWHETPDAWAFVSRLARKTTHFIRGTGEKMEAFFQRTGKSASSPHYATDARSSTAMDLKMGDLMKPH